VSEEKHQMYLNFINELFNNIKDNQELESDYQLANWMGEARGSIAQYRSGKRIMNDWLLLKICESGGFSIHSTLGMILFKKSLKRDVEEGVRRLMEVIKRSSSS